MRVVVLAVERLVRSFTVVVALTVSVGAFGPNVARGQDAAEDCAGECDEASPASTPEEQRSAIAGYERRAVIFGVTGAALLVGGIATMIVAMAAWGGSLCDISSPDCAETARLINSVSAGATFVGVLAVVASGLSAASASRARESLQEQDPAPLSLRVGASPEGATLVLTGLF